MLKMQDSRPKHTRPTCRKFALLVTLLAVSLASCSTWSPNQQPRPVEPARVPPPPVELMKPPSCGLCSENVRELFKQWLKLLTLTQPA